jgi:hypothetical protein
LHQDFDVTNAWLTAYGEQACDTSIGRLDDRQIEGMLPDRRLADCRITRVTRVAVRVRDSGTHPSTLVLPIFNLPCSTF